MINSVRNLLEASGFSLKRNFAREFKLEVQPAGKVDELNLNAANTIIEFASKLDFFYEGAELRKELRIDGAWKNFLMKERKTQSKIYKETKNTMAIARFHQEMFFNELIKGLWNYGYVNRGRKPTQISRANFMSDLKSTNIIYRYLLQIIRFQRGGTIPRKES